MNENLKPKSTLQPPNLFNKFDSFIKIFIPNFNVRAILYMSFIFAVVLFLQFWRV